MSYQEHEREAHDPVQHFDEMMGDGVFFHEPFTIRMKGYVKREDGIRERREIVKLRSAAQPRDYVFIEPYILVPDIHLDIDLFPIPSPTGAMGNVTSADWTGMKQEGIGDGQAWYYHHDKTIILWELTLFPRYQEEQPLTPTGNLSRMWQGFERFLANRYPNARRIATLGHDPDFATAAYQGFLHSLGYGKRTPETFTKLLKR